MSFDSVIGKQCCGSAMTVQGSNLVFHSVITSIGTNVKHEVLIVSLTRMFLHPCLVHIFNGVLEFYDVAKIRCFHAVMQVVTLYMLVKLKYSLHLMG